MEDLTRDSYCLLCLMYDLYKNKIKQGMSKNQAKEFKNGFCNREKRLSKWHEDDIYAALKELSNKKYLKANILGDYSLTDNTVIKMENKFKDNAKEILDVLSIFI